MRTKLAAVVCLVAVCELWPAENERVVFAKTLGDNSSIEVIERRENIITHDDPITEVEGWFVPRNDEDWRNYFLGNPLPETVAGKCTGDATTYTLFLTEPLGGPPLAIRRFVRFYDVGGTNLPNFRVYDVTRAAGKLYVLYAKYPSLCVAIITPKRPPEKMKREDIQTIWFKWDDWRAVFTAVRSATITATENGAYALFIAKEGKHPKLEIEGKDAMWEIKDGKATLVWIKGAMPPPKIEPKVEDDTPKIFPGTDGFPPPKPEDKTEPAPKSLDKKTGGKKAEQQF